MDLRVAFPTDEHFPFQDENARSVALQIIRDFDPDVRVTLSDGLDFYSISSFDKDPTVLKAGGLQKEIDAWIAGQKEWLDASPHARVYAILGNHEDRLRKYLWKHPELSDLEVLKLENLLHFERLNIRGEVQLEVEIGDVHKLVVKHGKRIRQQSAYSARAELEKEFYAASVLTGHTHRGGTHYAQTRRGVVTALECYCLCRLDPAYDPSPNWQQGIVLSTISESGIGFEPILFTRHLGKVVAQWRGKEYRQE
jgi:predicted phosphodiesterase